MKNRILVFALLSAQLARADWNPNERYVVLTDKPAEEAISSLKKLYTGQLDVLAIDTAVSAEVLSKYDKAILYLVDPKKYPQVPFDVIKEYAAAGHPVVTDLGYYAWAKQLKIEEHVEKDTDLVNFNQNIPWMEIVAESEVTSGFPAGSIVPWYGGRQVQEGESKFLVYRQRFIPDLPESGTVRVLGRSSVKKGALLAEETVGKGHIIVIDLCSLGEPRWLHGYDVTPMDPESWKRVRESGHFGDHCNWRKFKLNQGSFNKYVFLGNVVNRAIEFGQHENRFLRYAEILKREETICAKNRLFQLKREASQKPKWEEINKRRTATTKLAPVMRPRWEFGLSPNEPDRFSKDYTYPTYEILSLTAGDDRRPIILLTQNHGNEWSGVYGHLDFADWLSRHADDEYLAMKLNNYCLKLVPMFNPAGYEFNWGSGSEIDDLHDVGGDSVVSQIPEARDYYILLRVDFHEMGGGSSPRVGSCYGYGFASALEERICTELCSMFRNRFLYSGGLGAIQLMSQPFRECRFFDITWPPIRQVFPTEPQCLYQSNMEVNQPVRHPNRMESFAMLTEEIACQDYCTVFPRKWPYAELKPAAGADATVRAWRWSPDDTSGFRVITFSKSHLTNEPVPRIDWERFEIATDAVFTGEFYRSPATGWEHAEGARWGCIHSLGGAAQDLKWTYMTKPTFSDWHNWVDADFFRPLLKRHLACFDQNHDGFFDTFLLDENNDGYYDRAVFHDRRKESAVVMTHAKVTQVTTPPETERGLLWQKEDSFLGNPVPEAKPMLIGLIRRTGEKGTEYGWSDLFHTGFSALGTSLAKRGAWGLKDLGKEVSGETLTECGAVVITRLDKELDPVEVGAIKDFVSGGGRVLVAVCTHEAKDLASYNQLLKAFGMEATPEVVSSYVVVSPRDFCYLQTERIEFEDRSGLDLLPPNRRIMVMSYVLKGDGAKPVILLNGKTVGSRVKMGKGEMLVLGSAELVSNESLSDRLNHPLTLDQADYPLPAGNAEVRDRLAGWMAGGLPTWLAFLEAPKPVIAQQKEAEVFGFGEETTCGGHKMITMENGCLKVGIVPGLGGRIVRFVSKRNGHDQFLDWRLKSNLMNADGTANAMQGGYTELSRKLNPEGDLYFKTEARCREEVLGDKLVLEVEIKRPNFLTIVRRMELARESSELKMATKISFLAKPPWPTVGFSISPAVGGIFRGVGDDRGEGFVNFLRLKWAAFQPSGVSVPTKLDYRQSGILWSEKEYFCFQKEDGTVHEEQIDGRFCGAARWKTLPPTGASPWVVFLDKGHKEILGVRYDPLIFGEGSLELDIPKYLYTFARYIQPVEQREIEWVITLFAVDGMVSLGAAGSRCLLGLEKGAEDGTIQVRIGSTTKLEGARLVVETIGDGQSTGQQVQETAVPLIGAGMSEKVVLRRPSREGSLKLTLKGSKEDILLSHTTHINQAVDKEASK